MSGLVDVGARAWSEEVRRALGIESVTLPELVDTAGHFGRLRALPGSPPLCALIGDQPASLFGQGCVHAGTKITFGTGAILNTVHARDPVNLRRLDSGCYPTVVRSLSDQITWGLEAIDFSAGSCVQWLSDLGVIADVASSAERAASVASSDGVIFVPAFAGLGTPRWDFGARGAFFGLTRGTSAAHLARAVLEGVAHRGADLVEATERESGTLVKAIHVDGGMSVNTFFTQCLADVSGREVVVSAEREATTRGAGLMALVGAGLLTLDDVSSLRGAQDVAVPSRDDDARARERARWNDALERSSRTIPELSAVSF